MAARWDGDHRGQGIGSAAQLVSGASELVAAFSQPAWVAEQPELHLLPHVEAWCRQDGRLALTGAVPRQHVRVPPRFRMAWRHPKRGGRKDGCVLAHRILAESATYVRQRRVASDAGGSSAMKLQFEIGTGELAPDASFEPHGHIVLINVAGVLHVTRPR